MTRRDMAKTTGSQSVPKSMQATYEAITGLTDAFCREHLNEDYAELARRMTAALCRKRPSPLASGQPRTWACAIVYALGQLNFLSDKASRPHMAMADVCAAFGVGQGTAGASQEKFQKYIFYICVISSRAGGYEVAMASGPKDTRMPVTKRGPKPAGAGRADASAKEGGVARRAG